MKVRVIELGEILEQDREVPPAMFCRKSAEELVVERLRTRLGGTLLVRGFRFLPEEMVSIDGEYVYPISVGCLDCSQGRPCSRSEQEECEAWCCSGCLVAGKIQRGHFVCILPHHRQF